MTVDPAAEEAARAELERRINSQAWRLSNLYWVEDENGRKCKFRPRLEQRELHNNLHSLNVVLKCRQPGISTYCALLALDFCLFSDNKTVGVIDKTDPDAKKKLEKIKFAYDHLDDQDDPDTAGIGALIKQAVPLVTENKSELKWANGSKIWAGTNMRGGTLQMLWWTEAGYKSFYDPKDADEIRKGALNTIHVGNRIIIESTHEGGKFGIFYGFVKLAMEAREPLGPMDWRFTFFPWHKNANYTLAPDAGFRLTEEQELYFRGLADRGVQLTDGQKHWYVKKRAMIGDNGMMKEFPSFEAECFEAIISGAIYGKQISDLRAKKQIADFEHDRTVPIFGFWDLGFSDYTAFWLIQLVGREVHALAYRCNRGVGLNWYVAKVRELEARYETPVMTHYLPHDADKKELTSGGKSARDVLRELGVSNTRVVVRTPDVWQGINRLRALLPRFVIHKTECGGSWQNEGRTMPGGIGCLEGYHTKEDASSGIIKEDPVHDDCSHGADALRTFAEAELSGALQGSSMVAREQAGIGTAGKVILAGYQNRDPGQNWRHLQHARATMM